MSIGLWLFLILFFAISLGVTLYIFKAEEKKMRKLEAEGDTVQDEIQRSLEYETASLKGNVPVLTWIYTVAILGSLLAFFIYLAL